jgi:AraC family ethanolamine operon transcriptional activator
MSSMTGDQDGILQAECAEVDELMSRLRGISATGVPLRPGRYAGSLIGLDLGDVGIQILRSAPMLMLGSTSVGGVGLMQAMEGSDHARWNGKPLAREDVAVLDGSRQHAAIYPDDFACAILSYSGPAAERIVPAACDTGLCRPGAKNLRPGMEPRSALAEIGRAIETALATSPGVLHDPEARRSLRASLLDTAEGQLTPAEGRPARATRDGRTRQRIVHEADEYLRANPARPVYTEELCAALGSSATRLQQAFQVTFGISPHRYLKMRRMGMVRAMLLSRAGRWHSVKAAALSHGFWHLGQFAHDYRALYGESPSETLARARPEAAQTAEDAGL